MGESREDAHTGLDIDCPLLSFLGCLFGFQGTENEETLLSRLPMFSCFYTMLLLYVALLVSSNG